MTPQDALEIVCKASLLAVFVRWLFPIDIPFRWVLCVGLVSLTTERGLFTTVQSVATLPASDMFMGTGVVLAFLGVVQVVRS